jgi:DNA-binding transcriptional LysR family regulator
MTIGDAYKFDFNLLRALHVLLRERNVTRAANELHVTQQAMSGSLKRLRQYFGARTCRTSARCHAAD